MVNIHSLVFNPYQENTYILFDETHECVIIDPGCVDPGEQEDLKSFILKHQLQVVKMVFTHGHFDHLCGSKFVHDTFSILPVYHREEVALVKQASMQGSIFGFNVESPPEAVQLLDDGDLISFGNATLQVIHTPGHSPGSVSLFNDEGRFVIVGDVLFFGSIGRTDLPGGDYDVLMNSINQKLLPLGDDVDVYPGHGPKTDLGSERHTNPFIEKSPF